MTARADGAETRDADAQGKRHDRQDLGRHPHGSNTPRHQKKHHWKTHDPPLGVLGSERRRFGPQGWPER